MNEVKTFLQGKKKILTAIIGVISGLAIIFGVDQGDVSTISGAVVSLFSIVSYLVAEGKIDVERIRGTAEEINNAFDIILEDEVKDGES